MGEVAPSIEELHLIHYPDPRLRGVAKTVEEITDEIRAIADRMIDVMHEARGVGLAAPQVGLDIRLIVLKSLNGDLAETPDGDAPTGVAFVNPVIVSRKGFLSDEEGCLSLPDIRAKIRRSEQVTVRAWDLDGQERLLSASGVVARAWQHEIDHLDGLLIIDKMTEAARINNARRLRELEAVFEET
ncbi:MAG: peptide deformylase [Planctomycetota bacterium]